jgi:hypothetical protein
MVRKFELTDVEKAERDQATRRGKVSAEVDMGPLTFPAQHPTIQLQRALTPAMVMQLQRTIGNAQAGRLLARDAPRSAVTRDMPTQRGAPSSSKATRVIQRKVGRTDGVSDMDAEQTQKWLQSAGLWQGLAGNSLDMIEAMMQSEDQWTYSGLAVYLVQDAKWLIAEGVRPQTVRTIPRNVSYKKGLIHGDLIRDKNAADFHVDKGDGAGLTADMLVVTEDVYEKMTLTSRLPERPDGQVYLRPQGAAIIKIVSQMLGEALGDPKQVELAHTAIKWRKFKEAALDKVPFYTRPKMSAEVLDKSIVPEHAEYMKALVGVSGVDIKPLIPGTKTIEEFTQNMLEASAQGRQRLQQYLETVEEASGPVSMDIFVGRQKLPVVIALLRRGRAQ